MSWSKKEIAHAYSYYDYGWETGYRYTQRYILDNPSKLHAIETDIDENSFDIKIFFADNNSAQEFSKATSITPLEQSDNILQINKKRDSNYKYYSTASIDEKTLVLAKLIALEPRVMAIQDELIKALNLEHLAKIRKMPTDKALDLVISNQIREPANAFWLLLNYWNFQDSSNDIVLKLAKQIHPDNPGFPQANDIITKINDSKLPTSLIESKAESKAEVSFDPLEEDEEQRIKNLEELFSSAIHGTDQNAKDKLFSQLCNDPKDKPVLRKVSGDLEFLLSVAKRFREERALAEKKPVIATAPVAIGAFFSKASSEVVVDEQVQRLGL